MYERTLQQQPDALFGWVERSVWKDNVQPTSDDSCVQEFCAICQDTIIPGEHIAIFVCKHHFHYTCARKWMSVCICGMKQVKCPVCNYVLLRATFQQWDRNSSRASTSSHSTNVNSALPSLRPVHAAAAERNFTPPSRTSCMHGVRTAVLSWCG
jgi:hypothetical protein